MKTIDTELIEKFETFSQSLLGEAADDCLLYTSDAADE